MHRRRPLNLCRMLRASGLALLAAVALAACSASDAPADAPEAAPPPAAAAPAETDAAPADVVPMPGGDRDAHGCIPSAGYAWCARTQQCERPWELAEAQDFENTSEAFAAFCAAADDAA